jgi:beta-lactamase class A
VIPAVATPAAPAPPSIVEPAPYQAFFGHLVAGVPRGTARVVVLVNGRRYAARAAHGRRVAFTLELPLRDLNLSLLAIDSEGRTTRSAPVGPVFALPPGAAPRPVAARGDPRLERRIAPLIEAFPGTAAAFVRDLVGGVRVAVDARERFAAGSTLKLAIAVEALRSMRGPPARGSGLDALLRAAVIESSNEAANQLEVVFGGSTSGGSARVNAMMRTLGLVDSEMYGGYETDEDDDPGRAGAAATAGLPAAAHGKYTTAADLGRLLEYVYLATAGRGPLVRHFGGAFSASEARYLLYLLLHVNDRGKLDRFLPPGTAVAHKAGWISTARHDNGILFWQGGAFVAAVMTSGPGVGTASDVLAGRIAQVTLARLRARH